MTTASAVATAKGKGKATMMVYELDRVDGRGKHVMSAARIVGKSNGEDEEKGGGGVKGRSGSVGGAMGKSLHAVKNGRKKHVRLRMSRKKNNKKKRRRRKKRNARENNNNNKKMKKNNHQNIPERNINSDNIPKHLHFGSNAAFATTEDEVVEVDSVDEQDAKEGESTGKLSFFFFLYLSL